MSLPSSSKPEEPSRSIPGARGSLRLVPLEPASTVSFRFDGETIEAGPGETISVALYASGRQVLRTTSRLAEPRGLFCNMGVCFECLVEVDGLPNVRACQTAVRAGMQVRTQHGTGLHRHPSRPDTEPAR
jgi:hypothetical protein